MLTFDFSGVHVTIRLDWLTLSIRGIDELPASARSYLGAWRDQGKTRHHYHSSFGPGYICRWGVREKCKNWSIELELQGEFFSSGKDLDFLLGEIFCAGGFARPSRIDLATDYYGPVDPFQLESIRGQFPKGKTFHFSPVGPLLQMEMGCSYSHLQKWLGFKYGKLPGRVYDVYDKAHEQVVERRKKLPAGVTDWFRYEFRLGSEYLHVAFPDAVQDLSKHSLTWSMVGWSGDQTSFRCGFFSDLHRDLKKGRIPCKETVSLTFDGAFNVLCDDVFSKLNNFRKRFSHLRSVSNSELFQAVLAQVSGDPSLYMGDRA